MALPLIDQVRCEHEFQAVPLEQIWANPLNPRQRFEPEALAELVESVKAHGILEPLLVTPNPDEVGGYLVVCGERRRQAAVRAELSFVPVMVREMDQRTQLELMLAENIIRADLDPVEEARGLQRLLDECGMTQAELGQRLGKSQPWISNRLRLLRLPETVLAKVESGELSPGHAQVLLKYDQAPSLMAAAAKEIIERKIPVAEVEQKALNFVGGKAEDYRVVGAYNQAFAARGCAKCPHYREAGYQKFCLDPACYDKKQAEGLASKSAKIQDQTGGLTIEGLRRAGTPFAADWKLKRAWCADCEGCDKVKMAMPSYGDKPERICLDPECVERHISANEEAVRREATTLRDAAAQRIRLAASEETGLFGTGHFALVLVELLRTNRGYGQSFGHGVNLPSRNEFLQERFGQQWPGDNWNDDLTKQPATFEPLLASMASHDAIYLQSAIVEWVLICGYGKLGPALDLVGFNVDKPSTAEASDEPREAHSADDEVCEWMGEMCGYWVKGACTRNETEDCPFDSDEEGPES